MPGLFGSFVVPTMLAQPTDLANWTGTAAPANATNLLRSATSLVLEATASAYYPVDPATGLSTDAPTAAVLRDATCIQAAAWVALGIDPATGGVSTATVVQEKSLGSARLVYANAAEAEQARSATLRNLVPEAMRKLALNNLLTSSAWVYG